LNAQSHPRERQSDCSRILARTLSDRFGHCSACVANWPRSSKN
jgi:hypothetical protein